MTAVASAAGAVQTGANTTGVLFVIALVLFLVSRTQVGKALGKAVAGSITAAQARRAAAAMTAVKLAEATALAEAKAARVTAGKNRAGGSTNGKAPAAAPATEAPTETGPRTVADLSFGERVIYRGGQLARAGGPRLRRAGGWVRTQGTTLGGAAGAVLDRMRAGDPYVDEHGRRPLHPPTAAGPGVPSPGRSAAPAAVNPPRSRAVADLFTKRSAAHTTPAITAGGPVHEQIAVAARHIAAIGDIDLENLTDEELTLGLSALSRLGHTLAEATSELSEQLMIQWKVDPKIHLGLANAAGDGADYAESVNAATADYIRLYEPDRVAAGTGVRAIRGKGADSAAAFFNRE